MPNETEIQRVKRGLGVAGGAVRDTWNARQAKKETLRIARAEEALTAARKGGAANLWHKAKTGGRFAGRALNVAAVGLPVYAVYSSVKRGDEKEEVGKVALEQSLDWGPYLIPPALGAVIGGAGGAFAAGPPGAVAGAVKGAAIGNYISMALGAADTGLFLSGKDSISQRLKNEVYSSNPSLKPRTYAHEREEVIDNDMRNLEQEVVAAPLAQPQEYYTPSEREIRKYRRREIFKQQAREEGLRLLEGDYGTDY